MRVSTTSGIRIYDLTAEKRFPIWLQKARRSLKQDKEYRDRVTLLQGLTFPGEGKTVSLTSDGKWMVAVGTYPPQSRLIDLEGLSTKVSRSLDGTYIASVPISPDWTKQAYLLDGRRLQFHAQQGTFSEAILPRPARCLAYDATTAEVLAGGNGGELWRYSLEFGRWMRPWDSGSTGINCICVCQVHGLVAVGTESGALVCFDPRSGRLLHSLDVAGILLAHTSLTAADRQKVAATPGITSLCFSTDGLHIVVGVASGFCLLFDLRAAEPVAIRSHLYGEPIRSVAWHDSETPYIISADAHAVRIWAADSSARQLTVITPSSPVTSAVPVENSGLLFVPTSSKQVNIFFIPALGPAPAWCSFLDSAVGELDEKTAGGESTVYDDYVFCTDAELDAAGLRSLVGTPAVRPMLHGHYVRADVYRRAAAPGFDDWVKRKAQARVAASRAERIGIRRGPAKTTQHKMLAAMAASVADKGEQAPSLVEDPRFADLLNDGAFTIDTKSAAFASMPEVQRNRMQRANEDSDSEEQIQAD